MGDSIRIGRDSQGLMYAGFKKNDLALHKKFAVCSMVGQASLQLSTSKVVHQSRAKLPNSIPAQHSSFSTKLGQEKHKNARTAIYY